MKFSFIAPLALLPFAILGCSDKTQADAPRSDAKASPPAAELPSGKSPVAAGEAVAIPKGANHLDGFDADVLQFTEQGSGFMPMAIVRALNDSKTGRPYLENLERFGLVPGQKSARNPEGFPVGIVTNIVTNEGDGRKIEMFGFTCAACHTSDIRYKGQTVRIDGASGLFYVDELGDQIGASLKVTMADSDALLAFLTRYAKNSQFGQDQVELLTKIAKWDKDSLLGKIVRGPLEDASRKLTERLKDAANGEQKEPEPHKSFLDRIKQNPKITDLVADEKGLVDKAFPALAKVTSDIENLLYRLKFLETRDWLSSDPNHRLAAGFGRADDFGTARVELFGGWNPKNMLSVNSPVSVPPIWNVGKYAWLHWNANTNSVIQRSIGEALGVGASFNAATGETSVAIANQMKIEEQVHKLTPPEWPAELFGAPEPAKVKKGKELFDQHCAGCHVPTKLDDKGLVIFRLSPLNEVNTDPLDATNFDRPVFTQDGSTVGFAASIASLLNTLRDKARVTMSAEDKELMDKLELKQSPAKWRDTMTSTGGPVYPARPLEGVWATAPYLHNGSVPTLYHLLFPEERPQKFLVGQKDFDPVKVGFELDPTKITQQKDLVPFEFDTSLPGNLNRGHEGPEYGTELSREDRLALIEYLKVHHDKLPSN